MPEFTCLTSIAGISEKCSVLLGTKFESEPRELRMQKIDCLRDTYVARASMPEESAKHCRIGVIDEDGESDDSAKPHCVMWFCENPDLDDGHRHIIFLHQGTDVRVCGNIEPLGNWDPRNITYPKRSLANGMGVSSVCVSADVTDFEYKLIKKDGGELRWEEPAFVNRRVSLESSGGDVIITGDWVDNSSLVVTDIKTSKFEIPEEKEEETHVVIYRSFIDKISKKAADAIAKRVISSDVISSDLISSDVISSTLRDVINTALGNAIDKTSRDVTSRGARSTESERESHPHEAARTQSAPVVGPSSDRKPTISEALRNYADLAATASTPVVSILKTGRSVCHKPSKIDISELVSSRYGNWPAPKRGLLRRAYSAAASAGHSMRKQISHTRILRKLTA